MAERVVTVSLRAQVADYIAGMEKAGRATRDTGTEAEKLAQKGAALEMLGRTALVMGSVIAAGIGIAVVRAADFDEAMSNVNAVMQETTENQKLLRQAALDFGASSVFTAKESANAIEELGKAGLSTADILGGALAGSLNLAAAGQLGIARAAEISATTLSQFNLSGSDAARVADVLAAGAGKALGSVEDLANGLKFVGPVANSMGISLEQTTGVLALFAQQGIIGEQAGTSLRGMLSSLTSPSSLARKEMERLGITLNDEAGAFLGLENVAGELSDAFGGLTDEQRDMSLGMIFGNQQITAARVLYQGGAESVAHWTAAVDDSGFAAQVARDRLDNLKGDVEQLGGAFDTALITTGSAANDVLRVMVQGLTNLVDLYNGLPDPVKTAVLAIAGITAAALLAGGAFLLGAPKVAAFNAALAVMGPTAQRAGALLTASLGPIGVAFAVAGVAIAIFAGEQADARATTDEFKGSLDGTTGALTNYTRELVARKLAEQGSFEAAERLGVSQRELTDAVINGGDELAAITKLSTDDFYASVGFQSAGLTGNLNSMNQSLNDSQTDFRNQQKAMEGSTDATDDNAAALDTLAGKVSDAASEIRGLSSVTLDARDAQRQFQSSIDDAAQALIDNGVTLDTSTEAGRANEASLDGIARAALAASAAVLEKTGSETDATAAVQAGREALILQLAQYGIVGQAAEDYADDLGLIPANIATAVSVVGISTAQSALDSFIRTNDGRTVRVNAGFNAGPSRNTFQANGSVMDFYADGGMAENHVAQIAPAGAWRVWAEPETGGEAYIPLAASKRARSLDIWAETGHRLGVNGFADGGIVRHASSSVAGMRQLSGSVDQRTVVTVNGNVGFDPAQLAAELAVQKRKSIALSNIRGVGVA